MGIRTDPATEARCRELAGLPPIDRGTPEVEFQRRVIAHARGRGWAVLLVRPVRVARPDGGVRWETPFGADGVGFPDLTLVRERVVFAELKTDRGTLRPAQEQWLNRLRGAGQTAVVLRPCMWAEIVEMLK